MPEGNAPTEERGSHELAARDTPSGLLAANVLNFLAKIGYRPHQNCTMAADKNMQRSADKNTQPTADLGLTRGTPTA